MNLEKFAKPWQAMPSRIICLALEHAQQNTDFDHQLAFLLLDVGVESALKTYLINKKQDVEKIVFSELLKRVGEELHKDNLEIPLDEIEYFHKTRNKLYHQGDGVKPTGENLTNYAMLAKALLKNLLDVDVDETKNQELAQTNRLTLLARIRKNIASLESNSALIVEHLYPKIATQKIVAQLRYIRIDTGPDDESYTPSVRAEFVQQRIDAFNKIIGWELTEEDDYKFIEAVIDNPEQLHAWLAFEKLGNDDWRNDWWNYNSAVDFLEREQGKVTKTDDKRYEGLDIWTNEKAKKVYDWIKTHIPDVEPKGYSWSFRIFID